LRAAFCEGLNRYCVSAFIDTVPLTTSGRTCTDCLGPRENLTRNDARPSSPIRTWQMNFLSRRSRDSSKTSFGTHCWQNGCGIGSSSRLVGLCMGMVRQSSRVNLLLVCMSSVVWLYVDSWRRKSKRLVSRWLKGSKIAVLILIGSVNSWRMILSWTCSMTTRWLTLLLEGTRPVPRLPDIMIG